MMSSMPCPKEAGGNKRQTAREAAHRARLDSTASGLRYSGAGVLACLRGGPAPVVVRGRDARCGSRDGCPTMVVRARRARRGRGRRISLVASALLLDFIGDQFSGPIGQRIGGWTELEGLPEDIQLPGR